MQEDNTDYGLRAYTMVSELEERVDQIKNSVRTVYDRITQILTTLEQRSTVTKNIVLNRNVSQYIDIPVCYINADAQSMVECSAVISVNVGADMVVNNIQLILGSATVSSGEMQCTLNGGNNCTLNTAFRSPGSPTLMRIRVTAETNANSDLVVNAVNVSVTGIGVTLQEYSN